MHYEVRFHLLNGKNYRKWQIKSVHKGKKIEVLYYDPQQCQLELTDCKLANRPAKAQQVFESGVHDVSGWVQCKSFTLTQNVPVEFLEELHYNPIKDVHWRRESDAGEFSWDNSEYKSLITHGRYVYVLEERT